MPARQLIFLYLTYQPLFPITYRMHIAYFFPKKTLFCMHMAHIFFTNVFDISMFNPNVKQHVNDIKQSCKESAASQLSIISNSIVCFWQSTTVLLLFLQIAFTLLYILSQFSHPCASFLNRVSSFLFFYNVWTSARVRSRYD